MKQLTWMLATVLFSAMFLVAGDKNAPHEMVGWVCNVNCVDHNSGKATCNTNCSEARGDVVYIDSNGAVHNIAKQDQDKAQPMAGKKCKVEGKMDKDTGDLAIQNIVEYQGP